MNSRQVVRYALGVGAVACAIGIGTVVGEEAPPTQSKGVQISAPVVLDLAPWAEDMKSRQLRIRKLTVEPGGVIGLHSHDDRPDVSYVLQGTLVEHGTRGLPEERSAGRLGASGKGVTHWLENKGTQQAILIVADVFKP